MSVRSVKQRNDFLLWLLIATEFFVIFLAVRVYVKQNSKTYTGFQWFFPTTGQGEDHYNVNNDAVNYTKSIYYTRDTFPLQIILKSNGFYIPNQQRCIQTAIEHINEVLRVPMFTFDEMPKDRQVIMQNVTYAHDGHTQFDGPGWVLAHAFKPPYKLVCYDASEDWERWGTNELIRTTIHELGHTLGLEHAFDRVSIMSYNDIQGLQNYDIECLKIIYDFLP